LLRPPTSPPLPYTTLFRSLDAGEGTRMKSKTPKVLHELCGRALVDHMLGAARELGPERLVVVSGHDRERVGAHLAETSPDAVARSEEHTSELQSRENLVCR